MHAIHSALNMASFKLVYLVCFISISLWLCSSAHRVLADNEEQGPIKPDNFFGFGPIWGKGKDGIFGGGGGGGGGSSSYGTGSGSGYGSGSGSGYGSGSGGSSYGYGSGSGGSGSGYGSGSGGSGSGYGSGQGSGYGGGGGGGGSSGDGSGHGSGYGSGSGGPGYGAGPGDGCGYGYGPGNGIGRGVGHGYGGAPTPGYGGGGGGGGYGMPPYGPGYGGGWVPAGLCEFCNKGGFVYGFQGGPSSCYVMSGGPHPTPTHPPAGQTEPINEMKSDPKSTLTVNPTPNSPPAGNTEPINNIKEKIKPDHDGGKPKPRSSQSVHPTSDHPSPFTPPISQSLTPPTAPDLHPILGN
ncbi:hypothetical protein AQUCO_02300196v1 [Aquilegia coerulea]|uniref:Glycine-rich protein n=1 Tax=Aquilegia coerulea TaxID=218851 RepID=A0A2G5DCI4_AQUCA|nr:hypothetical protein AQUCO_02300196v1 [Aquilegia coerulea]PIA41237.1 hypothetical protein AQUCO_02300196v1 [Aquilegia coerulea]